MARIRMALPEQFLFSTELPLYISHINYGNHLDNAQLLTLVSEARVRFFKWLGFAGELHVDGHSIVVADMQVQYKSEAFHGEVMQVQLTPADFNRYGCDLVFLLTDQASGREIARGKTGIVFLNSSAEGAKQIAAPPPAFLHRLSVMGAPLGWQMPEDTQP